MTPNASVVAFETDGLDSNGEPDIYVRDLDAGSTTLASTADGSAADGGRHPAVDDSARFVVFESDGALVGDDATTEAIDEADTNGTSDVYVRDLLNATTARISVNDKGDQSIGSSTNAAVSSTGRFVAFVSSAVIDDGVGEGNERPCDPPAPDVVGGGGEG